MSGDNELDVGAVVVGMVEIYKKKQKKKKKKTLEGLGGPANFLVVCKCTIDEKS